MAITLTLDAVDQILQYIDEQPDVLNVALCSKALFALAVPRHLHYRDIRTRLNNPALWALLSRGEDLRAPYIRSLTILPDQEHDIQHYNHSLIHHDFRERLPPECMPAEKIPHLYQLEDADLVNTYRKAEISLVFSLRRMTRLRRFIWYHAPQPFIHGEDSIWSVLQKLGTVKTIDFYDRGVESMQAPLSILFSSTFHQFTTLTTLVVRADRCPDAPYTSKIPINFELMLLHKLPDLKNLTLSFGLTEENNTSIDKLLTFAKWPKLRTLQLHGVYCRASTLARFLAEHSGLEELVLAKMTPTAFQWTNFANQLPKDSLPNLRHLECASYQAVGIMKSPHLVLETLNGIELGDMIEERTEHYPFVDGWEDDELRQSHLHYAVLVGQPSPWKKTLLDYLKTQRSITRLRLAMTKSIRELEKLAVILPQIRELDLTSHLDTSEDVNSIPDNWYMLCGMFPSLEVVGAPQQKRKSGDEENDSARLDQQVQVLSSLCPQLKVVFNGETKAVILKDGRRRRVPACWVWREPRDQGEASARPGEDIHYGL